MQKLLILAKFRLLRIANPYDSKANQSTNQLYRHCEATCRRNNPRPTRHCETNHTNRVPRRHCEGFSPKQSKPHESKSLIRTNIKTNQIFLKQTCIFYKKFTTICAYKFAGICRFAWVYKKFNHKGETTMKQNSTILSNAQDSLLGGGQ